MMRPNRIIKMLAAILIVAGIVGGLLYARYQKIKTGVIENQKSATAAYVQKYAGTFLKPEYFQHSSAESKNAFRAFFEAIQSPAIIRVKIWDPSYTIIWSNLPELIGQKFLDNTEVKEALDGEVAFDIEKPKDEHVSEREFQDFGETYVPIQNAGANIVGVVEIYQPAEPLMQEIHAQFKKSIF